MTPLGQFDGKIDAQGEFHLYDRFWERLEQTILGKELSEVFAKALAEEMAKVAVEGRRARWSFPIAVSLTEARTDPKSIGSYPEAGDCILCLPDSTGVATIYLNDPTSHGYQMGVDYDRVRGYFHEIYVSNAAQSGCYLYLLIGEGNIEVRYPLRSIGDAGASATNARGKTILKWLSDIAAILSSVAKGDTLANDAVNVGTAATLIIAANSDRKSILIYNNGDTRVYMGGAGITAGKGMPTLPGAALDDDVLTGAIYGVVAAGTCEVRYWEVS